MVKYTFICNIYTEHQKKLITSSERRSLKSTASKLIIFRHRYAKVLLMKHIWIIKRLLLPRGRRMWRNCKRSLFKIHRNCSLRTCTKGRLFRTFNSYSFNFKGGLCNHRTGYCPYRAQSWEASSFCDFWKITSCDFTYLILFDSSKRKFLEMCLVRSIIANLCPIMIHCNALDFNVCRSEEVISFFWRSVYVPKILIKSIGLRKRLQHSYCSLVPSSASSSWKPWECL